MQKKRMKKAAGATPAFQVYPSDELSDPRKMLMSVDELGCCWKLRLICWKWNGIPNDPKKLAALCLVQLEIMEAMLPTLLQFFLSDPKRPGKLFHEWNERERQKQADFRAGRLKAAEKGGAANKARLEAKKRGGNGEAKGSFWLKPNEAFSSSSSSSSSELYSPKAPKGAEGANSNPEETEARMLLRAELGSIFKRPPQRAWSPAELEALEALGEITPEEIRTMKLFYAAKIDQATDRRRTTLRTLLKNWAGELDKAQVHNKAMETRKFKL